MQRLLIAVLLSTLLATGCSHQHSSTRVTKRAYEKGAREAAVNWLELLDAQEYEEAFEREAPRVRAGGTTRQFVRSMNARRAPFGRALSRKVIGTAYSRKLTGAPDADYESVLFKTSFEHKSVAAERVILIRERDEWKVVDYRLY